MKDWRSHLTQYDADKAREHRARGLWVDRTLADYLADAAAAQPEHPAVIDRSGALSYRDLASQVLKVASGLVSRGVESGDVVSAQLPNWREAVVLAVACTRIGAVYNGISPIFRARDVRRMLALARPHVFVTVAEFRGFDYSEMAVGLAADLGIPHVVLVAEIAPAGAETWDALKADRGPGTIELPPSPDADSVGELAFTSGTTGEPKGILHTHNTALAATESVIQRFDLGAGDVFHMASTIGHQTGYLYGVQLPIVVGGTAVLQEVWEASEFVRLIEAHGVTMTNGAIPFLADLLRAPNLSSHDVSSLRLFGCFGAGLPESLANRAHELLPATQLFGGWGMTETGLAVTNLPGDSIEDICATDGVVFPGTELRILDETLTVEQPVGSEGQLVMRGAHRHLGFLQQEFNDTCFLEGDWYITGDRGFVHPDGQFSMTTRAKDIIVRGGEKIPVAEVESVILSQPGVLAVAVVAVPHERLGEQACACVVLDEGDELTLGELQEWCSRAQLTRHFWPEHLRVVAELPMTPSGKIQKFALREALSAEFVGAGSA